MTSKSTVKRVAAQKAQPEAKKEPKVKDFINCGDCDTHNEPGTKFCVACGNEL